MTNWDLFNLLHGVANKDKYSNWISPEVFSLQLAAKNIRLMNSKLGLPERYQPGTMQSGASASRVLESSLEIFRKEEELIPVDGKVKVIGWYYILDFWSRDSIVSEIISHQEFSSRIRNPLMPEDPKYPYAKLWYEGLDVRPATLPSVTVNYYRKPATPAFNTSVNTATGELQYLSTSAELEWGDSEKLEILYMIMQDFGVEASKSDLLQLSQKLVETGK